MTIGRKKNDRGFTLLEVLISVAIAGMIIVGLQSILTTALSSSASVNDREDSLLQARSAMERMVMFASESDRIVNPAGSNEETLMVSERILDTYGNSDHAYASAGDAVPDSDSNSDGIIDRLSGDGQNYMTFDLDRTDPANWKLMEQMPDYATAPGATLPKKAICEHVTQFQTTRLSSNLVRIRLTAGKGRTSVSLQTTAKSRLVE